MLIEALLNLIVALLHVLFLPLQIDSLPDQISQTLLLFIGYIADGVAVVAAYTHFSYLLVLLGIVIVVNGIYFSYSVIMWILKKIPFLGIH